MPLLKRKELSIIIATIIVIIVTESEQVKLPGPLVYVVTPASPQPNVQIDSAPGRGAYYYNSWRRHMDAVDSSITTTTPRSNVKTPDLIFADFESDNGKDPTDMKKSIRRLLERERLESSTPMITTKTNDLIFAEFESEKSNNQVVQKSIRNLLKKERVNDNTDSTITFSNMHDMINSNENNNKKPTADETYNDIHMDYNGLHGEKLSITNTTTTTTDIIPAPKHDFTTYAPMKLEDIWHVINNEKINEGAGKWDEVPINVEPSAPAYESTVDDNTADDNEVTATYPTASSEDPFKDNFVYPGFNSHNENTSENESRAIRTESNVRFPYVNLKNFQMKNKPLLNSKKGNNMYTSVDNFKDEKNPLRGEAHDSVPPQRVLIDRYNPAQPYLPSAYGSANKQTVSLLPASTPVKTVAQLIPPPPPPPSRPSQNDFPVSLDTYESFPPYNPVLSAPAKPQTRPMTVYRPQPPPPPADTSDAGPPPNDDSESSGPPSEMGGGYMYKPPESDGSYDYSPSGPSGGGYDYKPPLFPLAPPSDDDNGPPPEHSHPPSDHHIPDYSYKKPVATFHGHGNPGESDYPDLIFSKPHMNPMKGNGDMDDMMKDNGGMDGMMKGVEMMPPPPPPADDGGMGDSKPDFPNLSFAHHPHDDDYKFHHHHEYEDFDNYHHHHHHTTTTTTTTTEMPRVNRFSYYYLGKKLYYLPLYFSVYFVIYVAALIIKAVLRHKIIYPNSWKPYSSTSKRSVDEPVLSGERLHEMTRVVTNGLMKAAERYTGKTE